MEIYLCIGIALFLGLIFTFEIEIPTPQKKISDREQKGFLRIKRATEFCNRISGMLLITNSRTTVKNYLEISLVLALLGIGIGIFIHNILVSTVLAFGLPFFQYQLLLKSTHDKRRNHNEKLEIYMSMVTNAYMQDGDLIMAIYENYKRMDAAETAAKPFKAFIGQTGRSADISQCVLDMKQDINNKYFRQWCDKLERCLNNFSIKQVLPYSINRMRRRRNLDAEMVTECQGLFKDFLIESGFALVMTLFTTQTQPVWKYIVMNTIIGKIATALVLIVIIISTSYVVKVCRPVGDKK